MFWRKETNRAAAFVDHEYWFISMKNFYHTKPGLKDWCSRLRESYQVESIRFFGNFLDRELAEEVARIREVSNEIIETNCDNAGRVMKDMSDVIMCFNHSINDLLARTTSGTLQLSIDDHGLRFSFEAPHTARGDEMLELVRRGDISQCSFRFSVAEDVWAYADNSNALEMSERTVLKIAKLYDTSLVVYPAYPDTEALMRLKLSIQQDVRDLIASDISSIINARYCQFLELKE